MDDITIIQKQTGLSKDQITHLYNKNNCDIIDTICEIEGFQPPEPTPPKKLTPEQIKIQELREMVNQKDKIMDDLVLKKEGK